MKRKEGEDVLIPDGKSIDVFTNEENTWMKVIEEQTNISSDDGYE